MEEGVVYVFGMMVLLGLAVLVVAKIGNHYLRQISRAWAFVLAALGVGSGLADQAEPVQRVVGPGPRQRDRGDGDRHSHRRRRLLLARDPAAPIREPMHTELPVAGWEFVASSVIPVPPARDHSCQPGYAGSITPDHGHRQRLNDRPQGP